MPDSEAGRHADHAPATEPAPRKTVYTETVGRQMNVLDSELVVAIVEAAHAAPGSMLTAKWDLGETVLTVKAWPIQAS